MLDHYVVSRIILMATAVELIAFVWIYGSHHMYNDFEFVLGYKLTFIWNFIWSISPLLIIVSIMVNTLRDAQFRMSIYL